MSVNRTGEKNLEINRCINVRYTAEKQQQNARERGRNMKVNCFRTNAYSKYG